jgi:hypothetical protein
MVSVNDRPQVATSAWTQTQTSNAVVAGVLGAAAFIGVPLAVHMVHQHQAAVRAEAQAIYRQMDVNQNDIAGVQSIDRGKFIITMPDGSTIERPLQRKEPDRVVAEELRRNHAPQSELATAYQINVTAGTYTYNIGDKQHTGQLPPKFNAEAPTLTNQAFQAVGRGAAHATTGFIKGLASGLHDGEKIK